MELIVIQRQQYKQTIIVSVNKLSQLYIIMNKLKREMEIEKKNFLLQLDRLQTLYPQYKTNPTEDISNTYNSIQMNIDKIFEKLYMIKNELLIKSDSLANNMLSKDEYINNIKKNNSKQMKKLDTIKNNGFASMPREQNIKRNLNQEIYYSLIQTIFLLGNGYFLFKLLRS